MFLAGAAGSGLRGMRDRLELFGGRLEIGSAPGAGHARLGDGAVGLADRGGHLMPAECGCWWPTTTPSSARAWSACSSTSGECEVVAEAADGLEAVEKALATRPEVAVLDLTMPRLSGLEAVRRIHQELPTDPLLVLTVHEEEEYVLPLVRAGASGYLVKDSAVAELLAAVRALHAGQGYFGPQAARVLAEQYRRPAPARGSLRHPHAARARGLPPGGRR